MLKWRLEIRDWQHNENAGSVQGRVYGDEGQIHPDGEFLIFSGIKYTTNFPTGYTIFGMWSGCKILAYHNTKKME